MLTTYLLVVMFCIVERATIVNGEITCEDAKIAQNQLESYYRWWYRLYYFLFFFYRQNDDVCELADRYRKRLCAEVVHACHPRLKNSDLEIIRDEIKEVGVCYKQKFRVELEDGEFWKAGKRMFRCETFKVGEEEVKRFYVSNGGKPGAALIFNHNDDDETKKYVKVARLVSGLTLNPWSDKKTKKKDETNTKQNEPRATEK